MKRFMAKMLTAEFQRRLFSLACVVVLAVVTTGCPSNQTAENGDGENPTTDNVEPAADGEPSATDTTEPTNPKPAAVVEIPAGSSLAYIPPNAFMAARVFPAKVSQSKTYQSIPKDLVKLLGANGGEAASAINAVDAGKVAEYLMTAAGTGPRDTRTLMFTRFTSAAAAEEALQNRLNQYEEAAEEKYAGQDIWVQRWPRDVLYEAPLQEGDETDLAKVKKQFEGNSSQTNVEAKIEEDETTGEKKLIVTSDSWFDPIAWWTPTETTLLEGSPEIIKAAIDNQAATKSAPTLVQQKLAALGESGTGAAVLSIEPIREALRESKNEGGIPPQMAMLIELVDDVSYVTVSGDLDGDPLVKIHADAPNEASAKKVEQTASDLAGMLRLMWPELKNGMPGPIKVALKPALDVADDALTKLEVTQSGASAVAVLGRPEGLDELGPTLTSMMETMRPAMERQDHLNTLKQIGLSLHNHHDVHREFPANIKAEGADEPHLSWRYAVLPYLEQNNLYDALDNTKAWNDEAGNAKLTSGFSFPGGEPNRGVKEGHTVYLSFTGKGTIADKDRATFASIADGTSNTVAVIAVSPERAVPSLAPRDINIDAEDLLKEIGPPPIEEGWPAVRFDGSSFIIPADTTAEKWRNMVIINDGKF